MPPQLNIERKTYLFVHKSKRRGGIRSRIVWSAPCLGHHFLEFFFHARVCWELAHAEEDGVFFASKRSFSANVNVFIAEVCSYHGGLALRRWGQPLQQQQTHEKSVGEAEALEQSLTVMDSSHWEVNEKENFCGLCCFCICFSGKDTVIFHPMIWHLIKLNVTLISVLCWEHCN